MKRPPMPDFKGLRIRVSNAIAFYWQTRDAQSTKQKDSGASDQGFAQCRNRRRPDGRYYNAAHGNHS